ncbi:MAG: phosphotransferase [Candidatus Micrarchaeota archaeon]|nr:phosphotransferase [Candidatus Micrarchaeota archaeon]
MSNTKIKGIDKLITLKIIMVLPIKQLKKLYGWKNVEKWHVFPSGHMNTNVYVKADGAEYNGRFYKTRSKTEIKFELEMLGELKRKGFPCPIAIVSLNGEKITTINGTNVVCFSFIQGVTSQPRTLANVRKVAKKTGELHLKTAGIYISSKRPGETLGEFKQFIAKTKSEFIGLIPPFSGKALAFVQSELKTLELPRDLEVGLVHGDIKPENVVFKRGEVAGFLDFDLAYCGDLLSDVASAALWWSITRSGVKMQNLTTFLVEYNKVRPMSVSEKRHFKTALLFQAVKQVYRYPYFVRHKPRVAKANSAMFLKAAKQIKLMDLRIV